MQSIGSTVRKCGGSWTGRARTVGYHWNMTFLQWFCGPGCQLRARNTQQNMWSFPHSCMIGRGHRGHSLFMPRMWQSPPWQCLKTCHRVDRCRFRKSMEKSRWKALSFRGSQITAALCRGPYCTLWQRVSIYSTEVSLLSNAIEDRIVSITVWRVASTPYAAIELR